MTVRNWEKYNQCPPANQDCHWDWACLKGAFPGKIMPTDWDGVVEYKKRFLVFETKLGRDVPIPTGQRLAFEAVLKTGVFTVVVLWINDGEPVQMQVWTKDTKWPVAEATRNSVKEFAARWAESVGKLPLPKYVDEFQQEIETVNEEKANLLANLSSIGWDSQAIEQIRWFLFSNLPTQPFRYADWATVTNTKRFFAQLLHDIAEGPTGPRGRYNAILTQLSQLRKRIERDEP